MREYKKFSASEDQFLRENYACKSTAALSKELGRSYQVVWRRCVRLNIAPLRGSYDGRPKKWCGCDETCPEFCPYDKCEKPR